MANCGSAAMKSGGEGGGGRGGGGVAYLLRQFETRIDAGAGVFERPPQKSILPEFVRGHRNVSNQVPTEPKGGGQSTSVVVVVALSSSSSLTKSSEQRSDPSMAPVAGNGKNSGTPSEGEEDSKAEGGCSSSQRTKTAEDNATEAANDEEKMSTLSSAAAQMDSSALRPPKEAISTHEETHRPGSDSDEHESNCRLHTKTECPFAAESGGGGGPQKLKKVARSVESLSNNSSAAANPTKDLDVFHVDGYTRNDKKTSDPLPPIAPATMSSGKSVPLLSNVKTPGVEKKPPPVPKKNPKVGRRTADEGDDAAGDSPDGSRVTSSSSSSPRVGESQTMPNLNQAKKSSRPTTLFPDDTSSGDDGGDGDRCKSLPLVSSAGGGGGVRRGDGQQLVSIGVAQKNTLFPCNRHRNRGRIVSSTRETEERRGGGDDSPNSGDDDGDDFRHALLPQRSSADLLMSLGTTRPGSSLSPADQRTTEGVCAESSTETTTAAAVDASDWSAEAFESESFLSDTFDFLGSSSDSAECETNTSPLKSWAETWCRTNQRRISDAREKDLVNARGKTSSQDEKAVKAKPLQYGEPNRTAHMARIASSNCYEKSAFDNRSDESAETTPATRFGVVLRPKAASSSLVRRSSMAAASPSRESTSTLRASNVRPDSVVIDRPTSTIRRPAESLIVTDDDDDRASFGLIRRKPSAVSTCSSILPLLVLPSQRTLSRTSAAGNTDARASAANRFRNSDRDSRAVLELGAPKDELDSELNAIDRAFNFLEDSGA